MSDLPRQLVLVLDLQQAMDENELIERLPSRRREIRIFKLSDFLGDEILEAARDRREFDFDLVAGATDSLVRVARIQAQDPQQLVEWFVYGRAPLPVFAHVGYALSAWALPVTVLNSRKDGQWDLITVTSREDLDHIDFFDVVRGFGDSSEASGRIAVFVSVMGNAAPKDAFRDYIEERGDGIAGIVEIRTSQPKILDAESSGRAASELARYMSSLSGIFPHAIAAELPFLLPVRLTWHFSPVVRSTQVYCPKLGSRTLAAVPISKGFRSRCPNDLRFG